MHSKFRLLVADDNRDMQLVLERGLSPHFQLTDFAWDTATAVAIAEQDKPDAVLLDVQMPGGGGVKAAQEIRQRAPQTAIVAFSGDESRKGVLDMLDAGAVTYVRKGGPVDELVSKIHQAITAHRKLHD